MEYKHLPAEKAAQIIMIYYIGMTVGRFLSGVLAAKLHSWKIIKLGQIVLGLALLLLILPGGVYLCALGMFLIGLGNGPLFPNFNYLTPENFGSDISQSVIGIQMASAYIGIMVAPAALRLARSSIRNGYFPVLFDTVLRYNDTGNSSYKNGVKKVK